MHVCMRGSFVRSFLCPPSACVQYIKVTIYMPPVLKTPPPALYHTSNLPYTCLLVYRNPPPPVFHASNLPYPWLSVNSLSPPPPLYHTSNLPYTFFHVCRLPPTVQSFPMLIADWYDEDAVTMDILSPFRYVKVISPVSILLLGMLEFMVIVNSQYVNNIIRYNQ